MTEIQAFMLEVCFYFVICVISSLVVIFFSDIAAFIKTWRKKRGHKKKAQDSRQKED